MVIGINSTNLSSILEKQALDQQCMTTGLVSHQQVVGQKHVARLRIHRVFCQGQHGRFGLECHWVIRVQQERIVGKSQCPFRLISRAAWALLARSPSPSARGRHLCLTPGSLWKQIPYFAGVVTAVIAEDVDDVPFFRSISLLQIETGGKMRRQHDQVHHLPRRIALFM